MSAAILANMAILLMAILLFFFIRKGKIVETTDSPIEQLGYFIAVTIVGILLMKYSVVISGARYDYRFLLYALSIKYLGPKVTLPSIGFITLFRFVWGVDVNSLSALCVGIILMVTIEFVYKGFARYVGTIFQVFGLIIYNILVRMIVNYLFYQEFFRNSELYFILILSGLAMFSMLNFILSRIIQIQNRSEIDYLTNLKNSRRFYQDVISLEKEKQDVILSVIDIDYFKQVNTVYGHLAGDQVLKSVSKAFLAIETKALAFYRMGGEEFVCLIYGQPLSESVHIIEELRQNVAELDCGIKTSVGEVMHVTFSAGITQVNKTRSISEALHAADHALYEAKDNGRNRVVVNIQ